MGKYALVLNKLPKWENPDAQYADKIKERAGELLTAGGEAIPDEVRIAQVQEHVEAGLRELMKATSLLIAGPAGRRHGNVLARYYRELRAMKGAMAEQEYDVNLTIAAFEALIPEQYENEGTTNIKLIDGGSVGVQWEPYSQVVDRDAHREWAIKEGLGRSLALPWQTTNSLTKERLMSGLEPPDGVKATAKAKVVLRKG